MVVDITMEEILNSGTVSDDDVRVLMFYGAGCGPCKATMPNYESASDMFTQSNVRIHFYRINAWEPPEQVEFCKRNWNINGVPTFKVFFRGKEIKEKVGGGDEPTMKKFIQEIIDEVLRIQENIDES